MSAPGTSAPGTSAPARLLALALAALAALHQGTAEAAAGPTGLWLTRDHGGVIEVSACGEALCLRVAGLVLDKPTDATPLDSRGRSQCGLELVNDAAPVGPNLWRGHILDPRNGSVWGVQIWLVGDDALALRGYAGIALFGRTETWTRYPGTVPADCRMSPEDVAAALQR